MTSKRIAQRALHSILLNEFEEKYLLITDEFLSTSISRFWHILFFYL